VIQFVSRRGLLATGLATAFVNRTAVAQPVDPLASWSDGGSGARFLGLVHHTDAAREYAYDRQSHVGKLDQALDEATARGWTVVDMTVDWRTVFPPDDMPVAGR
jgi:hypothetical protein